MIPVHLRIVFGVALTQADLRQRREAVVFVNPQVAAPAARFTQQTVAVPYKGRHAEGILLPAASAEGVITIRSALLCAVPHRDGFRQLMLRVPAELLLRVPRRQFGGDVAEVVIFPAFVLINPQAVVVQRDRGDGYIYFIYTNKLFAIIVCDHIHIIFCIFNFILENIVKPTKLRIYNCNVLQVTLAPRVQIIDNILH